MDIDFFLTTWTVTKGDPFVKVGQRIAIDSEGGGRLAFVIPPAPDGTPGKFGDRRWQDVRDLHYDLTTGRVIGTAIVPPPPDRNTKNKTTTTPVKNVIIIRAESEPGEKPRRIRCLVARAGQSTRGRAPAPMWSSEEAGEWEAEDEGGGGSAAR